MGRRWVEKWDSVPGPSYGCNWARKREIGSIDGYSGPEPLASGPCHRPLSRTAVDGDRRAVAGGWHALIAIVHIDRRTIRAGRGRRTPAARGLPVAGNEGDRKSTRLKSSH